MKISANIAIYLVASCSIGLSAPETSREEQSIKSVRQAYENHSLKETDSSKELDRLGILLRRLDLPKFYTDHRQEAAALRGEIQSDIAKIPGYADHFSSDVKTKPQNEINVNAYNQRRYDTLRVILNGIQRPETIRVLGEFLWDETDAGPKPKEGLPATTNAQHSMQALAEMGLKQPPETALSPSALPKWRAWYEEVKSGNRAFSFEGQNVEYRFAPNGEISVAQIKPDPVVVPFTESHQTDMARIQVGKQSSKWLWIGVLATLALAALGIRSYKAK